VNGLIAWWARNSVAANLLMVACVVAGVLAFLRVEREVFPSADFNGAVINVAWPGASPVEIEEQVILRIEEAVSDLDGINHINSTARENAASVNIEVNESVDFTRFMNEIKNRVDGISTFPQDVEPPIVSQLRMNNGAVYISLSGDLEERELNRLARDLRDEAAQLPNGSPLVEVWGAKREEVSIEVSEETLRRYGLTFDEVAGAVRGSSLNLAAGQVRTETGNIQVAARALANSEEEFGRIIVRQNPDGSVLRVRDVAKVVDGFEDRRQKREFNGKPSITIAVNAPETVNIAELSRVVNAWVDEKNKQLADKAQLEVWFDMADLYFARIDLVSSNAVFGLILVLIVLMLFLRPAVAFWVSAGIVISFAGTFIFMPMTGVTLNMLSLFGFLLVIGIVVDDAIIIGENIHNRTEAGESGLTAAIVGAQLVAKPVFFAVLTTMIAFAPWLFISGGASQFTRHITLTVVYALSFSLMEAFFILPAHLSHMKKERHDNAFYRFQGFFADGLVRFADTVYRRIIQTVLKFRYMTVAAFLSAFAISVALLAQGWVAFKFMPEVQTTVLELRVRLPEGAAYSRTLQIYDQVQAAVARLRELKGQVQGEDYVKAAYILADETEVSAMVAIVDGDQRTQSTKEVAEELRDFLPEIPDAEEIAVEYTMNRTGPDFGYGIESDDLEALRLATLDLQNNLRTLPGVRDVRNNIQSETPELQISMKPGAERFGLTLSDVSRQFRQAFYGEQVQRLPRDGQDIRVMVRYPESARTSLATIEDMRIRTNDGREVPLSVVAEAEFAPSFKRIDRRDRKRTATVTAMIGEDADRAGIMRLFDETLAPEWKRRHPEVQLSPRGDSEMQGEFMGEFKTLYAVAFFAMYMLLAIAFGSYWQPALVMSAIPFGFMGAAFGHFLYGLDFALFSFFGVGAAAGVVVNDNLVMIDYVNRLRAQGEGAYAALVKAGVERFRPILLTSVTTFVGLAPIMFERSMDAQFLMPTVVALAWGVFFALFVTLLFVPAMYGVGADIARFYRWAWTGKKQPRLGGGGLAEAHLVASAHAKSAEPAE
jgi:multidrug efflux pump subunit AcrB